MASYFLRSKHISRGKGARVTRAAAYRAGERIRDERTGEVYNYSKRGDVAHREIVLPSTLAGRTEMAWAQDRSALWNAAEQAGQRRNARLARELLVLLPAELTPSQRVQLVRSFSRELADKYGGAVDCAIHKPRFGADPRHHHAHLLMTTREVTPEGLGPRTTLELGGGERHLRGLGPSKADYLLIRERWAQVTNDALHDAGIAARIDHRSYKDQGINREPALTIPEKVFYAEQRSGSPSPAGEAIRARYRERVEARAKGNEELERVLQRQQQERRDRAREALKREKSQPKQVRWGALTRQERNERRRERYQANRALRDDVLNGKQRESHKPGQPVELRESRSYWAAEQAVRNWKAYRDTHGPGATAEQSVRNWLALNETRNQNQRAPAQILNPQHADARATEDDRSTKNRSHGPDFGL